MKPNPAECCDGEKSGDAMIIQLESNFMLLGDRDIASIDFDRPSITLVDLLEEISARSSNTMHFLTRDGMGLDEWWMVEVNGCSCAALPNGIKTSLQDGDRVTIKLSLICGG